MRIRTVGLAALAAASAVAAGCGGGGGDRLSQEEFVAAADAICAEANEQLGDLPDPETFEDIVELADQAIPVQEDAIEQLRELQPPEGSQEAFDRAIDLLEQQAELGNQLREAAEAEDAGQITELISSLDPIDEEADQIATDLGLQECGND